MKKYLLLLLVPVIALGAGRLQNSDFMTEAEITGAGGAVSQLLNDSKIYVTGNGINKTLDDAIAAGDIGTNLSAKGNLVGYATGTTECVLDKTDGKLLTVDSTASCGFDFKDPPISLPDQTGEGSKFLTTNGTVASWADFNETAHFVKDNLLECPNFRGCSYEGVITNGAGIDLSGSTTRSSEVPAFNGSKLNLNQSAAGTLDYTYTKTANFDGKQMVAYCEIKTANTGVTFNSMIDGVVQSTLTVSSDNSWKYYKIPFVGGATSQGFKIDHVTAGEIPDIDIDNCFIGKDANQVREIGQAHFVGKLDLSNDCVYQTSLTSFAKLVDSASCTPTNTIGSVTQNTNPLEAGVKIPNFRTDGYYRIETNGLHYTSGAGVCYFSLSKTTSLEGHGDLYIESDKNSNSSLSADVRFNTGDTGEVFVLGKSSGVPQCNFYGSVGNTSAISVHFYPDDTSTVVTQDTELTAKTANEFNFRVTATGVVIQDDFDIINGDCTITSVSLYNCPLNSGIFTTAPTVLSTSYNGNAVAVNVNSVSSSSITFIGINSAGSQQTSSFYATVTKSWGDLNKSQTIVGKFEQVEEVKADLTAETANEFVASCNGTGACTENYDFLNGNAVITDTSLYTFTFNTGIFTQPPNCTTSVNNGTVGYIASIGGTLSSTTVSVRTSQGNSKAAAYFELRCTKQGADYNKSFVGAVINASKSKQEIADIVREDIVSSDLCQVDARGNTGQTITANTEPIEFNVNEVKDNCNAWDGNEYVAQKDGRILISGNYQNNSSAAFTVDVAIGASPVKNCSGANVSANNLRGFNCMVDVSVGDIVSMRVNANVTASTSAYHHYITITELPDTASVLKSLVNETLTKCQTKYLSANVSSSGTVTDLIYNNLDTSKNYSLTYQIRMVNGDSSCGLYYSDSGGIVLAHKLAHTSLSPEDRYNATAHLPFFKPVSSTLTPTFFENTSCILESATSNDTTFATLCELPDTYVETTEF